MSKLPASIERSDDPTAQRAQRTMEPKDYSGFVQRCLRAMGRRAGDADPESLKLFVEIRATLDEAEFTAMQALLDEGYSYRDIAKALGCKHNSVIERMQRWRSRECA